MRFVHPWLLLLLPAAPLLGLGWFWLARQASVQLNRLVSPVLQPRLMPAHSTTRFHTQLALVVASFTLLTIAAARPQWGRGEEHVISHGRNLVIALDVSRSMLARDVHPNRLERARVDIMDLISELKGDRAALLAFRRRGVLLCPLTTDYAFLRQALDGVTIDSAPRGETDLADAIHKSLDALSPAPEDDNAILLITDGEDLAGGAVAAAREAHQRGVPIFTVGIGDPSGTTIPDEKGNGAVAYKGDTVHTHLDEGSLAAIARESGGRYVPLGTAGTVQTTLGSIFRQHLRQVAARDQQERLERRAVERYPLFLLPALMLLLTAALLSRGRLSARPRQLPPRVAAALILLLAAVPLAHAATNNVEPPAAPMVAEPSTNAALLGRAGARHAQGCYRLGRYAEAADAYETAARGADPDDAQIDLYNAALARHRAKTDDQAVALLQPLTHAARVGDRAAELLALAHFTLAAQTNGSGSEQAKLTFTEEAGAAFQQALRDHPDETRRGRNLARVENQLPVLRENARIARLLEQYGKTPPDQLAATQLREQRALMSECPAAFTNEAPEEIRRLEALADRQDRNTDLWVPLKQAVLQSPSLTNVQQRAEVERAVELTRDAMTAAAAKLRDLDPAACSAVTRAEPPVYAFWRGLAPPPPLLDEDIALQSNAIVHADQAVVAFRPDQPEALELTRLFQQRFPEWANGVMQAAKTDTNAPTLKPEDRQEIERLTSDTIPLQQQAAQVVADAPRLSAQHQALKNLLRIRDLLPKQKQNQQQQNQQQQNQQQQQQQQQQEKQQPPPEQQEQQEQKPQEQPKPEQKPPPDVQDLLQRALQREKEHETEKRQQMEHVPMLPNERDW